MSHEDLDFFPNIVGGARAARRDGETLAVIDPSTGEAYARVAASTPQEVDEAVVSATRALEGWSRATPSERHKALGRFADAVVERFDELARIEARNAGKPLAAVTEGELLDVVDYIRAYSTAGRNLSAPASGEYFDTGITSFFRREPIGAGVRPPVASGNCVRRSKVLTVTASSATDWASGCGWRRLSAATYSRSGSFGVTSTMRSRLARMSRPKCSTGR